MDAGQEQIKRMPFDLSTTAKDCAELIRPLAEQRGVKIILDLQPAGCVGDAERIGSVISNLLTNAVQYNQAEGEVRIATVARNGTAILSVSDTGPGISPEDLPRVFERFYRADKSRSSANTGLGLAISRAIIAAHGGSIEAASPAGQGATFTVRLPVC